MAIRVYNDVAVIGKKDKSGRVFVEPSDRKDTLGIIDVIDDVILISFVRSTCNAKRFMECQIDVIIRRKDGFSIDQYDLSG